jgi:hypothetical protein
MANQKQSMQQAMGGGASNITSSGASTPQARKPSVAANAPTSANGNSPPKGYFPMFNNFTQG